jgi:hypothetical protein
MLQTEYEFELPLGYVDDSGSKCELGMMRLATAADEILPLRDPRCQANEAYLIIILLSRVVTRLESKHDHKTITVTPKVIEGLFRADLAHLQALYNRINLVGRSTISAKCPQCGHAFEAGDEDPGGFSATPSSPCTRR